MITLVINLVQSKARLEAFKAANSPVLRDIVRIQAVDGQQLTDKWHHLSRWMHLTHEPSKFNILPAIGCFLSHRKCWQYVVENDLPYALVLEDDAGVTQHSKSFLEAYESSPPGIDWLKLHVNRRPGRPDKQQPIGIAISGIELCVDVSGSKSTGAYIITNEGAQKALNYRKLLAPIDHVEWLYLRHGLVHAQARENIFEPLTGHSSTITPAPGNRILCRLHHTARIGIVRATAGRVLLAANLRAAKRAAIGYGTAKHAT
jgi:GR25 family glycosyltransferase involved in LPS biosynthesis